jgi:hypothetical protein
VDIVVIYWFRWRKPERINVLADVLHYVLSSRKQVGQLTER